MQVFCGTEILQRPCDLPLLLSSNVQIIIPVHSTFVFGIPQFLSLGVYMYTSAQDNTFEIAVSFSTLSEGLQLKFQMIMWTVVRWYNGKIIREIIPAFHVYVMHNHSA